MSQILTFLLMSGIFAGTQVFAASLADATSTVNTFDFGAWLEKGGILGFAMWMIYWFQRRTDQQTATLQTVTERAIAAVEKGADSDRELAAAVRDLRDVVHACNKRNGP